uniref:DNA recombination protein RmuC n=1 Tax=Luteitalea sp. TaxID=2004800 RepID=UPI0025BD472E
DARALHADAAAADARAGAATEALAQAQGDLDELRRELAIAQRGKAVAETRAEEVEVRNREHLREFAAAQKQLQDAFKALAADALDSSAARFLTLAEERFRTMQEQASGELRARTDAIGAMVTPLAEKLTEYQRQTQAFAESSQHGFGQVGQQLRDVVAATGTLQQETARLVTALRTPHVRGRWGEVALRRVAELAGMSAHCDFLEQSTHDGDDGRLRPDVVVTLPAGRTIIIDAKVALTAYLDALEASSDSERRAHVQRHAQQLRTHVHKLAERGYAGQLRDSAEFVVLFIPGDTFLAAAAEADPLLIEQALEKQIVIATPSTLIALLRAVAYGWRQEKLAENAQRISDLGRDLHDRLATLVTRLAATGHQLGKTVRAYNEAVGTLETRVLPAVRRFDELGVPSRKTRTDPSPVDVQVRQPALLEVDLE